jgi:hypothetical protein
VNTDSQYEPKQSDLNANIVDSGPSSDIREQLKSGVPRYRLIAGNVALALVIGALWALMHRYQGFSRDAHLYAVQALAKIHPGLLSDLYFQNNSQDRFTIFSPLYAFFIAVLGLNQAALVLFATCTAWFLGAAWALAREVSGKDVPWLTVAALIITIGSYGAYDVFHFSEDYLTARSLAEALIVTSLYCYSRGLTYIGLGAAIVALFVHPLMALPGLLLLISLMLPIRLAVIGAAAGVLGTFLVSISATTIPAISHVFTVIDATWLEIVRERSRFLLIQQWSLGDWQSNSRPFLSLTISYLALQGARARKLCAAAALVGATGLAIASISSLIGPIAVFVAGQAWRWTWITGFVSVLLLIPTAMTLYKDEKCGPICALLLIAGWTFSEINPLACISVSLAFYLARNRISNRAVQYLRWGSILLAAVMVIWITGNSWTFASPTFDFRSEPLLLQRTRNVFGLQLPALFFVWALWYWIVRARSAVFLLILCAALIAPCVFLLHASFTQSRSKGPTAEVDEFAEWEKIIPSTGNVYVWDDKDSPVFSWLTLQRPSYLSVDQSAGVIFSRATALEVKRRSEVLLPITDPDWKLLSRSIAAKRRKANAKPPERHRLTANDLQSMCKDPQLNFFIAHEDVGFSPVRHVHSGPWKDWNLYDCRRVNEAMPTG